MPLVKLIWTIYTIRPYTITKTNNQGKNEHMNISKPANNIQMHSLLGL